MKSTSLYRSELVGKTQSKTAVLESLVRANVLNRTGNVDYNQYGKLDGVGFKKVSAKFVDNFIVVIGQVFTWIATQIFNSHHGSRGT